MEPSLNRAGGVAGQAGTTAPPETADGFATADTGATVVITHRVHEGQQDRYQAWLEEIGPICRQAPGILDWQVIRPVPGLTATFTVLLRFASREDLQAWMYSEVRRRLVEQVRPILAQDDDFFIRSGLDFWFAPEGAKAQVPVRWKQFLLTWSAIFPLALVVPLLVLPLLRQISLPSGRILDTLCVTGTVVALMVYVVMPRYTKLLKNWLFRG